MLAQAGQGMPAKLLEAGVQRFPGAQKLSPSAVRARLGSQRLAAAQVLNALCCLRPGYCCTPCRVREM